MTVRQLKTWLATTDEATKERKKNDAGFGGWSYERCLTEFPQSPDHERRWSAAVGMRTESEKSGALQSGSLWISAMALAVAVISLIAALCK